MDFFFMHQKTKMGKKKDYLWGFGHGIIEHS
jgi:hypothetical protein